MSAGSVGGVAFATLLAFAALDGTLCALPGPAVLFTIGRTLQAGPRAGILAALGVIAGNAMYFALSAFGVGSIAVRAPEAFAFLRVAGALYLIALGIGTMRERKQACEQRASVVRASTFASGVLVQCANPKAVIFFVSLLPGFISSTRAIVPQLVVLGVLSQTLEAIALGAYVYGAGRVRGRGIAPATQMRLHRSAGALLAFVGIGILLERR